MKREQVDFHFVPEHQIKMHERLINWARAQRSPSGSGVSPMFKQYRSSDQWGGAWSTIPVDQRDAHLITKGWQALPDDHRAALQWQYITPSSPTKACRSIGCTMLHLARLVIDGRQMLINRRV